MRRLFLLALAFVLLPACGGGEETTGNDAGSGGGSIVDVSLADFMIEPSQIAVEPGSYTFHVVNDGSEVHALEIEGPSGEVETGGLEPGGSADLTVDFSEDGTFEMYCPVDDHRGMGMEGSITVGEGGGMAPDETTTEEDSGGYGY
jgi:uncharacterized cupredoxin-like copper-binding protein